MANGQEGEGVVGGSAFYSYAVLSAGSPQVLEKTIKLSICQASTSCLRTSTLGRGKSSSQTLSSLR